jgi:hypothetical protein
MIFSAVLLFFEAYEGVEVNLSKSLGKLHI